MEHTTAAVGVLVRNEPRKKRAATAQRLRIDRAPIAGVSTGYSRGSEFRRIGHGALRHQVRAIAFRGMGFTFVTCAPFAGDGRTMMKGPRHA